MLRSGSRAVPERRRSGGRRLWAPRGSVPLRLGTGIRETMHASEPPVGSDHLTWPRYLDHLELVSQWLLRSIRRDGRGSAAYFSPLTGWADPYPETTGYLIPTMYRIAAKVPACSFEGIAEQLGAWLLRIELPGGGWPGGLYRAARGAGSASVFNTAQVVAGMVSLYRQTGAEQWRAAAVRGGDWLAAGVSSDGTWPTGNYRDGYSPSYYAQVAWPMLQVCAIDRDEARRGAAIRVLDSVVARCKDRGVIDGWGFDPGKPAFTHTIAYTLRGLMESAFLLDDWESYGAPCVPALERFRRMAELHWGRLAGAYGDDWTAVGWYSCLTGNAQIALCLLRWRTRDPDPRLLNAACKLIDFVCAAQCRVRVPGLRGGIAGSAPPWGRYMMLRYPNWAAKYFADALCEALDQIEGLRA